MNCGICMKISRGDGKIKEMATTACSTCPSKFHLSCLDLSTKELRQFRANASTFMCPLCREKVDKTPDTSLRKSPTNSNESSATKQAAKVSPVSAEKLSSFTESMSHLQVAFERMKSEMSAFTEALNSTSKDIDGFRQEIHEMKIQLRELDQYKAEVTNLRAEVTELRLELSNNNQRQFLKDVEITGLTENANENLPHIVTTLATKIGIKLDPCDVEEVKRVGLKSGSKERDEKPRPVIVTLTRRAPRDQMLRAARVRRGITTDMIEIPGNSRKIFINEHLTKENRVLFSKARAVGNSLKFKYVWTNNGNIFMRRSETSSILRVNSELTLQKLQSNSVAFPGNSQSKEVSAINEPNDGQPKDVSWDKITN